MDLRIRHRESTLGPSMPHPHGTHRVTLPDGREDLLIREEPLLLEVGGQELLTMRTPGRDLDWATGFLLSEGVIPTHERILAAEPTAARDGEPDRLRVRLSRESAEAASGRLTRVHEIRSSCGLCGLADVSSLLDGMPPLMPGVPAIDRAALTGLAARAAELQPLFRATGACHGAVLFGNDGTAWGHGEDVGRHNALDKAIGAAARAGHDLAHATAFLSGRAGFDLVIKCLRLGIGAILSVSAPSAQSVQICTAAGATLSGFVRGERAVTYCDQGRLRG